MRFSPDLSQRSPHQGTPDAIIHLVDEATAEPLVCELETMSLGEKDPRSEMVLTKKTLRTQLKFLANILDVVF